MIQKRTASAFSEEFFPHPSFTSVPREGDIGELDTGSGTDSSLLRKKLDTIILVVAPVCGFIALILLVIIIVTLICHARHSPRSRNIDRTSLIGLCYDILFDYK